MLAAFLPQPRLAHKGEDIQSSMVFKLSDKKNKNKNKRNKEDNRYWALKNCINIIESCTQMFESSTFLVEMDVLSPPQNRSIGSKLTDIIL